jgi:hypothetical protein
MRGPPKTLAKIPIQLNINQPQANLEKPGAPPSAAPLLLAHNPEQSCRRPHASSPTVLQTAPRASSHKTPSSLSYAPHASSPTVL